MNILQTSQSRKHIGVLMRRSFLINLALTLTQALSLGAQSQSFDGTWQGIFHPGPQQFHVVLEIRRTPNGQLTGAIYSPDQSPEPLRVDAISADGNELHFSVAEVGATWSGTLSPNGDTLRGKVTQGDTSELDLQRASASNFWIDPRIHGTESYVPVAPDVRLQVIDWGGSGRTLLLLTGLGNTAHIYDRFAQKLIPSFHVVGITRRGFGDSSTPSPENPENYTADRLGDDVVAVISSLQLKKPVLIGHSIAGEELSAVANHHLDAVSALIYLDAGFPYAFYDPAVGDYNLDLLTLQRQFSNLLPGAAHAQSVPELLNQIEAELPIFQRDLGTERAMLSTMPTAALAAVGSKPLSPSDAILRGEEKFTHIPLPALAIFAVPHNLHGWVTDGDPDKLHLAEEADRKHMSQVADSFARGVPSATVVRFPNADHYLFMSNEADVLRTINSFLATHPQEP